MPQQQNEDIALTGWQRFSAKTCPSCSIPRWPRLACSYFCSGSPWPWSRFSGPPYDPNATKFIQNLGPCVDHWLGTDHLGRDILSRLMQGTQVVLLKTRLPFGEISIPGGVAIWGVTGSLFLGIILGLNAGYRGGWPDQIIMQVLDALIAFPRIVLYMVVIAAFGQGDLVVIFAIAVTRGRRGWPGWPRSLSMDIRSPRLYPGGRDQGREHLVHHVQGDTA